MVKESKILVGLHPSPFMGLDTYGKAPDDAKEGPRNTAWFADLYSGSNFSFVGIYLQHRLQKGEDPKLYLSSAYDMKRQWTQSWETLRKQGWGCVFFYTGYGEPRDKYVPNATQAGIRHAIHIKRVIANLLSEYGSDNAGSVVYLDTENSALDAKFKVYLNALFQEMRHPGPEHLQPVRPGLYARDQETAPNCSEMIDSNPDLFTWLLDHRFIPRKKRQNNKGLLPIPEERQDGSLYLQPSDFDIGVYQRKNVVSRHLITNIPVGIQGYLNYDAPDQMPTRALTKSLTPAHPWDFDMSFVRDPRYPEASPRVRVTESLIARGIHLKAEKRMEIHVSPYYDSNLLKGSAVEPDAPLLLPDGNTVVTIDTEGNPIISSRDNSIPTPKWSAFGRVLSREPVPVLRRSRAITCTGLKDSSLHICYIARDLSIEVVSRPNPKMSWGDSKPLFTASPPSIHAFSNLTCISRGAQMSLFVISNTGHLIKADCIPQSVSRYQFLEDIQAKPVLLQGTALLALTPFGSDPSTEEATPDLVLVFGVSNTLLLTLFICGSQTDVPPPMLLGNSQTNKLFAHTRLAYNMTSLLSFQVAAISYTGVPVIYHIGYDLGTKTWKQSSIMNVASRREGDVELLPRHFTRPATSPPMRLSEGMADARLWSINPFGDLNFGVDPTAGSDEKVLMCAGTGPDNAVGVLYRRIGRANEDWFLVQ